MDTPDGINLRELNPTATLVNNIIFEDANPRLYRLMPSTKWGRRITILTLIKFLIIGLVNLITLFYYLTNSNKYVTNFYLDGQSVRDNDPWAIQCLSLFLAQGVTLFLVWNGCMKRSTLQVGSGLFYDILVIGFMMFKQNRRYQILSLDQISILRLEIGLDITILILSVVITSLSTMALIYASMDKRWHRSHLKRSRRIRPSSLLKVKLMANGEDSEEEQLDSMLKWFNITVMIHKLVAGWALITCFQLSVLVWHRSVADVLAIVAISLDLSLAFVILGFYAIHNECKKSMIGYLSYLLAMILISVGFLFTVFSISPTMNQPILLSQDQFPTNYYATSPHLLMQLTRTEQMSSFPKTNEIKHISGDLSPMFKDFIFSLSYLVVILIGLSVASLVTSLTIIRFFGYQLNTHLIYDEEKPKKAMFQLAGHNQSNQTLNTFHLNKSKPTINKILYNPKTAVDLGGIGVLPFRSLSLNTGLDKKSLFLGKNQPELVMTGGTEEDKFESKLSMELERERTDESNPIRKFKRDKGLKFRGNNLIVDEVDESNLKLLNSKTKNGTESESQAILNQYKSDICKLEDSQPESPTMGKESISLHRKSIANQSTFYYPINTSTNPVSAATSIYNYYQPTTTPPSFHKFDDKSIGVLVSSPSVSRSSSSTSKLSTNSDIDINTNIDYYPIINKP